MLLNYHQYILSKVSFDSSLFERELFKAFEQLNRYQRKRLRKWCKRNFTALYKEKWYRVVLKRRASSPGNATEKMDASCLTSAQWKTGTSSRMRLLVKWERSIR